MSWRTMIGTVFFDCGGVLTTTGERDALLWRLDERAGLRPGSIYHALYFGRPWMLASTGCISEDEYRQQVEGLLPAPLPEELRGFEQVFWADRLNPQVVQIARSLGRSYSLGVLSNATASLADLLVGRFALDGLFKTVVISALVGLRKPDPAIYYLAAERAGVAPETCLFIDDRERNTVAAAGVGMATVTFSSAEQLAGELRRLLDWTPDQ